MSHSELSAHQPLVPTPLRSRLNYQTKVEPYKHQSEALARMQGMQAFALLMAMRTGKTKVLLDDFGRLEYNKKVNDLLVIAPAGVYRTWVQAMTDHLSDDLRERIAIHVWSSAATGIKAEKERELFLLKRTPRVLLMNVEALSAVARAKNFCLQFLHEPKRAMIAVDESTIIKTPGARRTKFVNRVLASRGAYRRILSGLATPRSPLDLYCQFEFLDPSILGFHSFYTFRARYAILKNMLFGGRSVPIVVGYRDTEDLKRRIDPYSYRVEFRPQIPSTYTIREVTLTDEQKRIYADIKKFATTKLADGSHVTATIVIAQILRLHQVLCGYTRDETNVQHEIPERRTDELLTLLEDYNGKAIVWCSYDYSINKVCKALHKEYGPQAVARFWGGNVNTREAEEQEFFNNPTCRFMVATPSAGGRGRTWSNADLVIYYSSTDNLEHRDQSEQRAQGLDKMRQVDYIDLIAPGTVETKILQALRKKINMASVINGDNYKDWLI
jgi:SNF2-related domain